MVMKNGSSNSKQCIQASDYTSDLIQLANCRIFSSYFFDLSVVSTIPCKSCMGDYQRASQYQQSFKEL